MKPNREIRDSTGDLSWPWNSYWTERRMDEVKYLAAGGNTVFRMAEFFKVTRREMLGVLLRNDIEGWRS